MDPFLTTQFIYFFILESTKEHCTLPQIHTTDRRLYRSWEMDVSAVWLWNDSDLEHIASSQHGELQRFIKMNTHTHTYKVESSGRQNGHRHLTLYFILVSVLQDAKYIIIMLHSRWRLIHQNVNWCGGLYTCPGFIEKWSTAWERKQMKCMWSRFIFQISDRATYGSTK